VEKRSRGINWTMLRGKKKKGKKEKRKKEVV